MSAATATSELSTSSMTPQQQQQSESERLLPIANICRIMKRAMPEPAKMSKEAKAAIQECVSEFIGFVTSEASDRLVEDKRKTITGDDVIQSMQALGFDAYMAFLQLYLKKFRAQSAKGNGRTTAPKRGRKTASAIHDDEDDEDEDEDHVEHTNVKRTRTD